MDPTWTAFGFCRYAFVCNNKMVLKDIIYLSRPLTRMLRSNWLATLLNWNPVGLETDLLHLGEIIWLFHHCGTSKKVGCTVGLLPQWGRLLTLQSAVRWQSLSEVMIITKISKVSIALILSSNYALYTFKALSVMHF